MFSRTDGAAPIAKERAQCSQRVCMGVSSRGDKLATTHPTACVGRRIESPLEHLGRRDTDAHVLLSYVVCLSFMSGCGEFDVHSRYKVALPVVVGLM